MARVTGPLMSFAASGSVADTITFATWKGRPYVRQRVIPANPKSVLQVSTRAVMGFLAKNWAAISVADKATWQTLADAIVASPFNAYTKANLGNWTQFLAPSQLTPITRTGTVGSSPTTGATGGVGQVEVQNTWGTANDNWGLMIFKGSTGFTTARDNLIGVILNDDTNEQTFTNTGLAPGTHFYNFRPFTDDGTLGAELGETSGVST